MISSRFLSFFLVVSSDTLAMLQEDYRRHHHHAIHVLFHTREKVPEGDQSM